MIVVIDTNVWISALQFAKRRGTPTLALEKAMSEDVIATCDEIDAEVSELCGFPTEGAPSHDPWHTPGSHHDYEDGGDFINAGLLGRQIDKEFGMRGTVEWTGEHRKDATSVVFVFPTIRFLIGKTSPTDPWTHKTLAKLSKAFRGGGIVFSDLQPF